MAPISARERALQIARGVLAGDLPVLEAATALCPLLRSDPDIASKEDTNLMVAISSETDALPIGRVRQEWHSDSLPEKDREIARYADVVRSDVRSACERILARGQQEDTSR